MFQALRRIHVAASDFSRSRRFYGETMGLPEGGSFEQDWVEFELGPVILKLTPLRPGDVPARNQVAVVLSTRDLESTLTTLKERGVTVTRGPMDEFTGRSSEILDPDGYRIIVFQPSELHPDEEWVAASKVDEVVKQKLLARKQKSRPAAAGKGARKPGAPPKKAPEKGAAKVAAKKPAPKAKPKPAAREAGPKKPAKKGHASPKPVKAASHPKRGSAKPAKKKPAAKAKKKA